MLFSLDSMRVYLGIDLGTSKCSAHGCIVWDDNTKSMIFSIPLGDGNGDPMPSVAAFWNGEYHVGYNALNEEIPRSSVIYSSKRLLGRRPFCIDDYPEISYGLYKLQPASTGYQYVVSDSTKKEQYMDVDKVACEILEDIREKADKELKRQVDELKKERKLPESICPKYDIVAISVPSMFHYQSCRVLRSAAERAGFSQVQLVSEPVSAGFSYLRDNKNKDGCYLVYDMGGGTFDSTLIRYEKGRFTTIGKNGLENCGGDNIDLRIYDMVIENRKDLEYLKWNRETVFTNKMLLLLDECRKAKESLRDNNKLIVSLSCLHVDGDESVYFPRDEFESKIEGLVTNTIEVSRQLVSTVLNRKNPDGVILIGGSSNLSYVRQRVQDTFPGVEIHDYYKTDCVVSRGAVVASMMMKEEASFETETERIAEGVINGSSNIIGNGLRPMTKELCDCTEADIFIQTIWGEEKLLPAYTPYGEKRGCVSVVADKDSIGPYSQPLFIYRDCGDEKREKMGGVPLNRGGWKEGDGIVFSAMMDSNRLLHVYLKRDSDENGNEREFVIV